MTAARGIRRILLVDDDTSVRLLLAMLLQREGYEVVHAENGAQALEVVAADPVDAIVLDLVMPVMDGLRFLEEARGRRGIDLPILVLTAGIHTDGAQQAEIIAAGATEVAYKPLNASELMGYIRRLERA